MSEVGVINKRRARCRRKKRTGQTIEQMVTSGIYTEQSLCITDLENLNRMYLNLAREMCNIDPDLASQTLGIPQRYQKVITALTLAQIDYLAQSNVLIFQMRFTSSNYWQKVAGHIQPETAKLSKIFTTAMALAEDQKEEV